jgi:hypothetical protein
MGAELAVEWAAAQEQPVEDRPQQQLVQDPTVGIRAEAPRAMPRSITGERYLDALETYAAQPG